MVTCAGAAYKDMVAPKGDMEGAYLGKVRSFGKLGAHVFLIHANQGSVQFLSSLQVSFQQRTLAEFVVESSEAEPTRYLPPPLPP